MRLICFAALNHWVVDHWQVHVKLRSLNCDGMTIQAVLEAENLDWPQQAHAVVEAAFPQLFP